ncbi:uncharacterized protein LOC115767438 isoform X2 [Drosophila novamexicana]|uniref:uncharacterized protein LOC115767438 isoform X2 n=1 Tax=Drosophila novamexicana TaxID=47314 RepID=UPI0011E5D219|nr:uncharacterized protein LOC115767438 isoform X2 [Drosophila novamexicana]
MAILPFYILYRHVMPHRTVASGQLNNVCVSCDEYVYKECIVARTGMAAHSSTAWDMVKVERLSVGEQHDSQFNKCVSKGYKITDDLNKFVCFWSAELGCQAIANSTQLSSTESICKTCAKHCGCERSSSALPGIDAVLILTLCLGLIIITLSYRI